MSGSSSLSLQESTIRALCELGPINGRLLAETLGRVFNGIESARLNELVDPIKSAALPSIPYSEDQSISEFGLSLLSVGRLMEHGITTAGALQGLTRLQLASMFPRELSGAREDILGLQHRLSLAHEESKAAASEPATYSNALSALGAVDGARLAEVFAPYLRRLSPGKAGTLRRALISLKGSLVNAHPDEPLRNFGLNPRTENALARMGIRTAGDLVEGLDPQHFASIPAIGPSKISELLGLRKRLGGSGTPIRDIYVVSQEEATKISRQELDFRQLPGEKQNELLIRSEDLLIGTRARRFLRENGISFLAEMITLHPDAVLSTNTHGRRTLREIIGVAEAFGYAIPVPLINLDRAELERLHQERSVEIRTVRQASFEKQFQGRFPGSRSITDQMDFALGQVTFAPMVEEFRDRLGLGQMSPAEAAREAPLDWRARRLTEDLWRRMKRLSIPDTHTRTLMQMLELLIPCPEAKALELLEVAGLISRPVRFEGIKAWAELTEVECNLTIKESDNTRWITRPVVELPEEKPEVFTGAIRNVKKLLAVRESIQADKVLSALWPVRGRGRRSLRRADRPSLGSLENLLQSSKIALVRDGLVQRGAALDYSKSLTSSEQLLLAQLTPPDNILIEDDVRALAKARGVCPNGVIGVLRHSVLFHRISKGRYALSI